MGNCHRDFIVAKFCDRASHVEPNADGGAVYVAEGIRPINLAKIASAGCTLDQLRRSSGRFDDLCP